MAELQEVLPEFAGFAVRYDPSKNPFFKAIFIENMRLVKSVAVGGTLLDLIRDAKPKYRDDFPAGINVIAVPQAIKYIESGHAPMFSSIVAVPGSDRYVAPKGCNHYVVGSSANAAVLPDESFNGKGGSVCKMLFNNAQFITSKGESVRPYLVLAHELIHSYHCLYGLKKDDDEELWTSGIGVYNDEPMSENVFRDQYKIARRTEYY